MKKHLFVVFCFLVSAYGNSYAACVTAGGTRYECGDKVYESCTLDSDMICEDNYCLELRASDITIEGAGYEIAGNHFSGGSAVYISGSSGAHNVTVKNLKATEFYNGVQIYSSEGNVVENCEMYDNDGHGVFASQSSSNNIIQNNHFHENGNNAVTFSIDSMNNQAINNVMENGNYHGVEISDNSNNNIVSGNTISGNVQGILLYSYCHDNLVTGNTISNNEGTGLNYGIKIFCRCSSNTVSANSIVNNAFAGVWIDGYDTESNIVSDNLIRYNGVYGVLVQFEANGNTFSDNAIENSGLAGILLEFEACDNIIGNNILEGGSYGIYVQWDANGNIFSSNTVSGCYFNGIHLAETALNSALESNVVCGNGEDGVDIYDESVESTHSGDNNTCETAENWMDATGIGPCRYACVPDGCVGALDVYGCGDVIPESCAMNANLFPKSGGCFTVGADNIVVDGNGYTLMGTGTGEGVSIVGKTGVTVKQFHIKNFSTGVYLGLTSTLNEIKQNALTLNTDGVVVENATNNAIDNNTVTGNVRGISLLDNAVGNTLSSNTIGDNEEEGVRIDSESNIVTRNQIHGNDADGILLDSNSDSNTLTLNSVCDNSDYDIENQGSNTGDENECDSQLNWSDGGSPGCAETCVPCGCVGDKHSFVCGDVVTESCMLNCDLEASGECFTPGRGRNHHRRRRAYHHGRLA